MTKTQFAILLQEIQSAERAVRQAGQDEYSHDDDNAFANFDRIAKQLDMIPEKVLWVYLTKHMDGILAYLNGHKSQREDIRGRIKDARMYLALLWGMVEARIQDRIVDERNGYEDPPIRCGISAAMTDIDPLPHIPVNAPIPTVKSPRSPEIHGDPQYLRGAGIARSPDREFGITPPEDDGLCHDYSDVAEIGPPGCTLVRGHSGSCQGPAPRLGAFTTED